MHDGMTHDDTHYISLYAAYVINEGIEDERLQIPLLACSPMMHVDEDGDVVMKESAYLVTKNLHTQPSMMPRLLSHL